MGKSISISTPKGGVGKTTTAVNLSASLAINRKKVLLIDMDPAGSCSISLGIKGSGINGGVFNLLNFTKSVEQIKCSTFINSLDFIPFKELTQLEEERLFRLESNYLLLRNILMKEAYNYEYIIFDCPPYLRGLTTMALTASDSVLIPVRSAGYSFAALQKLVNHLIWVRNNTNSKISIEGILQTILEARTRVSLQSETNLYKTFGKYLLHTRIPKSTLVPESTFQKKPAVLVDKNSKLSKAYMSLAKELVVRNSFCPAIERANNVRLRKQENTAMQETKVYQISAKLINDLAKFRFSLQNRSKVSMKIQNLFDRDIETLVDDILHPGEYKVEWEPLKINMGIYKLKFEAGDYSETINFKLN